jgi:phosphoglycolate phosphatase-like HAD superfamily hydrolase
MTALRKLVLFDIDGTLVLTGGAGIRAMNRAGRAVLGVPRLLDGIPVAGRTDWSIFRDALEKIGRQLDDELFARLRDEHVSNLEDEILQRGDGVKAIMPGVRDLIAALESRGDILLGLLTGNFKSAARIKLEHFDLWRHFACGAFGDDAPDRNELVPFALERARGCGLPHVPYSDVVVVGDTPHDVACAQVVGARPVGVATGTYTVEQLQQSGAPVVLRNLSDTAGFMKLLDAGM